MANESYPQFSGEAIEQALAAGRAHAEDLQSAAASSQGSALAEGGLKVSAQCISVTVQNGKVCLNLPLGIGSVCLPVPSWIPNGTAAQACLDICTKWGIPCGVEVKVSVGGQVIVSKGFGCNC
jgi:hypothetical protein